MEVLIMKTSYKKLVRDKIPQLIEESGRSQTSRIMSEKEYHDALIDKIVEEMEEFRQTDNEEEIADVYEALDCLVKLKDYEPMRIDYLRMKKREQQGSYNDRILLDEVEE
jgi:predicted house-cleaning noncanonical NTP pyrophosphatase (MazG superfamily)